MKNIKSKIDHHLNRDITTADVVSSSRQLERLAKLFSFFAILLFLSVSTTSCKKNIEVTAPITSINEQNVFTDDATAAATLTGIFSRISGANITGGGVPSLSFYPGMSGDELTLFNASSQLNATLKQYYSNSLTSTNTGSPDFWNNLYPLIYHCNSAIEGLTQSTQLTALVKQRLLGEAKFLRAFCYFYLVNLYADVPLATSTNYEVNRLLPRSPKADIYQKIISDLIEAQGNLTDNYLASDVLTTTIERTRPSQSAATALLARTYLYIRDFPAAEREATKIINNTAMYDTVSLNNVFLKNSKESIWQLQPVLNNPTNTWDARLFVLPSGGPTVTGTYPVYLNNDLVNSFEAGDNRKSIWTNKVTIGSNTYHYPYKYKVFAAGSPVTEYLTVLRLAEQYLIRAEARAEQDNLAGARSDLNLIRKRAGLSITLANDKSSLSAAILNERRVELFTELGHRWFDLKRSGTITTIMSAVCTQKGGVWSSNWALYPIPQYEIDKNPSLVGNQNPGYQ